MCRHGGLTTATGNQLLDTFIEGIVRSAGPDRSHWWYCSVCGRTTWVSCSADICPTCRIGLASCSSKMARDEYEGGVS